MALWRVFSWPRGATPLYWQLFHIAIWSAKNDEGLGGVGWGGGMGVEVEAVEGVQATGWQNPWSALCREWGEKQRVVESPWGM